ncbi:MAG: hypothetical protein WCR20_00305, partial [Verrucomicrobiota bacterium]
QALKGRNNLVVDDSGCGGVLLTRRREGGRGVRGESWGGGAGVGGSGGVGIAGAVVQVGLEGGEVCRGRRVDACGLGP